MNHQPTASRPIADIEIPLQFSRLLDIAYNLWWTWTPAARILFRNIDSWCWERYHNPIEVLLEVDPERWHSLQNSEDFVRTYRKIVKQFDDYLYPSQPTWFQQHYPDHDGSPVAYFSTEFGWHECLQVYSGGLGILSGDHSKSASDLGLPFVGVGLMYRLGYFRQTIGPDGQQQHFYPDHDLHRVPLQHLVDENGDERVMWIPLPGRRVYFRVWKAAVGRVPVLLLDTDLPQNDPADRPITSVLYVSGREMRLCQEWVLGLGGVKVLQELGIQPSIWHMNEGHSSLLSLERVKTLMEGGQSYEDALTEVAESALFTTHTPVAAGHESFDGGIVDKYLQSWIGENQSTKRWLDLGLKNPAADKDFNLTVLALRTSRQVNGVSKLHGQVAGDMWNGLQERENRPTIESVTNGVHLPTWLGEEVGNLLRRRLGMDFENRVLEPSFADEVLALDDRELWEAHQRQKQTLIDAARQVGLRQLSRHGRSPDELREHNQRLSSSHLLIGFARRFATYKRADLLLADVERLKSIVQNEDRPVQFLFAGKAHPADRPGQDLIRSIWNASQDPEYRHRLMFIESYDMRLGRRLVQGVDVWLNNPRRPLEASGTSGMKASMNGGLNCSILDGWWCEGYDAEVGWTIGNDHGESDGEEEQDRRDAGSLYHVLEQEIVPTYYSRDDDGLPRQWIQRMKTAIARLSPRFSTQRMVSEYATRFYFPER